jgi:hypothetical protein
VEKLHWRGSLKKREEEQVSMKKEILRLTLVAALAAIPVAFTTGCASHKQESAGTYSKDKDIASRIKTSLDTDPIAKGTDVTVQSLNGVVQLSGFVDSQAAKDRAGEIAASTPGVVAVHNNLLLPTGRETPPATAPANPPGTAPVTPY